MACARLHSRLSEPQPQADIDAEIWETGEPGEPGELDSTVWQQPGIIGF